MTNGLSLLRNSNNNKKYRLKRHAVTQPTDKPFRLIPLTRGLNAIVDVEDFETLNQWNWSAHWNEYSRSFYAIRTDHQLKRGVFMHTYLVKCDEGQIVDHRNHDTLDYRKENLRACTHAENTRHGRIRKNNSSGFKGVSFHKGAGKWMAYIRYLSTGRTYLGLFLTAEDAAKAYDEAAKVHHGEFAKLNFQ